MAETSGRCFGELLNMQKTDLGKASFVIATYNRADELERCIDSILIQENCDFEILVIDDASKDRTCELVRSKYLTRKPFANLVRYFVRDFNCGSVKNRNYGASLAHGDVLFLVDDDTEFPGKKTVCEVMREFENPRVSAVAIPYFQDGKLCHDEPGLSGDRFVRASYVGCACAVRRTTFLEHGGYEEFFHHQVEEDDLCIRMLNDGMVCLVGRVSEPMVHHQSPKRNFFNWDFYGRRNSLLYIWKNCPTVYVVPNLILTTLRGVQHCFKVHRFKGNLLGLIAGYQMIVRSAVGKGCKREPVRKEVYDLTLRLRKGVMSFSQMDGFLKRRM